MENLIEKDFSSVCTKVGKGNVRRGLISRVCVDQHESKRGEFKPF